MTASENTQGPDFFAEFQGDKPNDGKAERDTEGHFFAEFQGDNEHQSQQKDDDTEGHFMAE